jgi:hypothetical protein
MDDPPPVSSHLPARYTCAPARQEVSHQTARRARAFETWAELAAWDDADTRQQHLRSHCHPVCHLGEACTGSKEHGSRQPREDTKQQ